MRANEFQNICTLIKEGRDEMVNHPQTHEDGRVLGCDNGNLLVKTEEGQDKEWKFEECYEIHQSRDDFRFG